eukprot:INCI2755.2.p1 GENE.INCI2755.2~~INCI2755.2.p1  ORF type:complete len:274 (+),score=55.44 INCI2755.2:238-1059(+)
MQSVEEDHELKRLSQQRAAIDSLAHVGQLLLDFNAKQQLEVLKLRLRDAILDVDVLMLVPSAIEGGGAVAGGGAGAEAPGAATTPEDVFELSEALRDASRKFDSFAERYCSQLPPPAPALKSEVAARARPAVSAAVKQFFKRLIDLIDRAAATRAAAEAANLQRPVGDKPVAPVVMTVGLQSNKNLVSLISLAKPAHVAQISVHTAANAYEYINLSRVKDSDFRPHRFRVITTGTLVEPLRRGLRTLTLTPNLDCSFFDAETPAADCPGTSIR